MSRNSFPARSFACVGPKPAFSALQNSHPVSPYRPQNGVRPGAHRGARYSMGSPAITGAAHPGQVPRPVDELTCRVTDRKYIAMTSACHGNTFVSRGSAAQRFSNWSSSQLSPSPAPARSALRCSPPAQASPTASSGAAAIQTSRDRSRSPRVTSLWAWLRKGAPA